MAECLHCGRSGGEGGTERCGSGWFHGGRKVVALDVGRGGFPGAPLEQSAGSPKSSGERQPVSVLCVSWGRWALPMVFARLLQPARLLPMYVPLCRPRKGARSRCCRRKTPARGVLAGGRKPTAAGAARGAQGRCLSPSSGALRPPRESSLGSFWTM